MGSRETDQTTQHHQPHISSLVVRPSVSDGGDGGRDYEPGEVHRDPPLYSRSDRNKGDPAALACKNLGLEEDILVRMLIQNEILLTMRISAGSFCPGHRTRAGSSSPARRADGDHRFGSDLDHSGGVPRGRGFSSRREASGRHRDHSPPYVRGGAGAPPNGRGLDGPGLGRGPFRGDGMNRNNNPNVRPREGDWFCPDPLCRNLNFARREYCNNCKRHRYAPVVSPPLPRRDYAVSPPPYIPPPRHFPGPPMDLSPGRGINGYRSPPRSWPRDAPRDLLHSSALPPPRYDHHTWGERARERERLHYPDDDYPGRRLPLDWGHADCGRDQPPKPHYERRPPLSPPPPPPPLRPSRGSRWGRNVRDRSRSPMRAGRPLPRDYRHDSYVERGRDERRGGGRPARGRLGNAY